MAAPIRLPKPLVSGDSVAVVAASSCLEGEGALARLDAGIAILESWGLVVERKPLRSCSASSVETRTRRALSSRTCLAASAGLAGLTPMGTALAKLNEASRKVLPTSWLHSFK